ncbi:MAG: YjfB family protein [Pseudomonadota bacterium]
MAKLATSIAETGSKQEVGIAVLKKAQQIESATATQLIDAIKSVPTVQNLPAHLGSKINTTA